LNSEITKKRLIKQGAMQELLSGKKRLVGFSGEWEVKKLRDISIEIGDGIHATPKYVNNSNYFFVNGNNLVDGKISISEDTKCVSREEYNLLKKKLGSKSILMSINGTIGNLAFFNNEKIVLGKSAAYINLKEDCEKTFIYYILQHSSVKNFYDNELTGTTIRNLSLKTIKETPIISPSKTEQTAIAQILSDMDNDIQTLETERNKTQAIKQGMMQELLTGKTRLI
jgi:type I restriction enzyme S subunit